MLKLVGPRRRPSAQVIEELIGLAREMREANARGERLGLSDDALAFYDALGVNDGAVQVLGDETLRDIARELVETVRGNVTIDWAVRENVRAHLRRLVKRVLRKHGYPPDKQEAATRTVLEQAEALSDRLGSVTVDLARPVPGARRGRLPLAEPRPAADGVEPEAARASLLLTYGHQNPLTITLPRKTIVKECRVQWVSVKAPPCPRQHSQAPGTRGCRSGAPGVHGPHAECRRRSGP